MRRRPIRSSRPARSERRSPRSDTWGRTAARGSATWRPVVVRTTAAGRRSGSRPSNTGVAAPLVRVRPVGPGVRAYLGSPEAKQAESTRKTGSPVNSSMVPDRRLGCGVVLSASPALGDPPASGASVQSIGARHEPATGHPRRSNRRRPTSGPGRPERPSSRGADRSPVPDRRATPGRVRPVHILGAGRAVRTAGLRSPCTECTPAAGPRLSEGLRVEFVQGRACCTDPSRSSPRSELLTAE